MAEVEEAGSRRRAPKFLQQRRGSLFEEPVLALVANLHDADVGEARLPELADRLNDPVEVGPAGIASATSSGVTNWLADANPAVVGRSAFTFQPPPNQRNCSCARCTAAFSSGFPADRNLPDRAGPLTDAGGTVDSVPPGDEVGVGLDRDEVIGQRREPLHALVAGDPQCQFQPVRRADPTAREASTA